MVILFLQHFRSLYVEHVPSPLGVSELGLKSGIDRKIRKPFVVLRAVGTPS